jgi:hypothetical protein
MGKDLRRRARHGLRSTDQGTTPTNERVLDVEIGARAFASSARVSRGTRP